jgi:hypothetical protein
MHKIKSLQNLRYKPQGSEVVHCGSMGIDAYRVDVAGRLPRSSRWRRNIILFDGRGHFFLPPVTAPLT